ncbi:MAG: class I SAM-dependent methyltransferase [Proteobacteria bacterium]|nr:class I SAM-dependent methyltransferase [Pseudomonadota bacterium]
MPDTGAIPLKIGGHQLRLMCSPTVFAPNTTTNVLFDAAPSMKGLKVMDMGCGTGPIAIASALAGAVAVTAVDVMPEACRLTQHNARMNGVGDRVCVLRSFAFRNLPPGAFDLIISDISGMADEVARLSPWYPSPIPTGGGDGTELAIEVLQHASAHLRPGGRLIFPILSLSKMATIESAARHTFGPTLTKITERSIPFHPQFYAHRERLEALRSEGVIDFTARGSRLCWTLAVYAAQKP